jgi:release factor glutamine methyltransferase
LTVAEALKEGARKLERAGLPDPRRDAALLLRHLLGLDAAQFFLRADHRIAHEELRAYMSLIGRRASGEPMQYITGHQEFYGLDFIVTRDVLIPRPETELIVEKVIQLAGGLPGQLIVDVGTGSGCIAIALAKNLPGARLIATDISEAALELARLNAERHSVRIEFFCGDLMEPLSHLHLEGSVDFIASNPPYIPLSEPHLLQPEVLNYEPPVALFGGQDGLEFHRRLLSESGTYLKPGRYMIVEIGYGQIEAMRALIDPEDWELIEVANDLQGIPRALVLRKL